MILAARPLRQGPVLAVQRVSLKSKRGALRAGGGRRSQVSYI